MATNKGGRPAGEKTRCGGRWTEARYRSFIISALRGASRRWAPMQDCLKKARTRRGFYKCAGCEQEVPSILRIGNKKHKNAIADHIVPIVDPAVGFTNWDDYIERMFVEDDNWQCLCKACHDKKSGEERDIATARRRKEKADASK